jgi:DNA-binding transcriptional MerR regulator
MVHGLYHLMSHDALTIKELAERVGMSVRNLREWRTLGLLPRAKMHGRVGYYEPEVLDRVRRIQRLRAEGFTLDLIARMLDAGGDAADEVIRLAAELHAPYDTEAATTGTPPKQRMAEIAASLEEFGLTTKQISEATARIREHVEAIAEVFEQVWRDSIWEPFVEAGKPDAELPRIQATAARVKPLALEAVVAQFTLAMEAQIERGIAREVDRASST